MRWLTAAALLCAGCLSQLVPEHKSSTQTKPTPDLAEPSVEPDPSLMNPQGEVDAAQAPAAPTDDLGQAPAAPDGGAAGLKAFGAGCTVAADCASGYCEQIMMTLLCTVLCTMKGLPDPACPNTGMCNNNGFCKP